MLVALKESRPRLQQLNKGRDNAGDKKQVAGCEATPSTLYDLQRTPSTMCLRSTPDSSGSQFQPQRDLDWKEERCFGAAPTCMLDAWTAANTVDRRRPHCGCANLDLIFLLPTRHSTIQRECPRDALEREASEKDVLTTSVKMFLTTPVDQCGGMR